MAKASEKRVIVLELSVSEAEAVRDMISSEKWPEDSESQVGLNNIHSTLVDVI